MLLHSLYNDLINLLENLLEISLIIILLMIIIEILKTFKVLDLISNILKPVSKFLGISDNSVFPLVIGLILGLSYGAGLIIKSSQDGELSKKDLYLLIIFLVACHSVFEDTFLFVTMGANGWMLLSIRTITAIVLTFIVSRSFNKKSVE